MGPSSIAETVHGLGDLELAVLLSLVSEQHCIIETDAAVVDTVEAELRAVSYTTSSALRLADTRRSPPRSLASRRPSSRRHRR